MSRHSSTFDRRTNKQDKVISKSKMTLLYVSVLSLFAAVVCAQPQTVPARATKAIALIGNDVYLYGGSASTGECFSDLYSLHLDPANGWVAGQAPWNNIEQGSTPSPALSTNSWAVGSTDGLSLLFYGQSLCPQNMDKDANSSHTLTVSSGSVQFHSQGGQWSQTGTAADVLGPRLVKDDMPVPVQVVDIQNHMAYTFVYDAFNPQLGMQLWSFSTDNPPANIAQSAKNTTMLTTRPPRPLPPTNGTNETVPTSPPTTQTVLAPFVDVGCAIYHSGTIIVIGGGRTTGVALTGDGVDSASGWYKMDRCWVYTIATNEWNIRNLTAPGGSFPLPRRLAALLTVEDKIYMHGGNTTQTVATDSYAKDLWILDTTTWQWTSGPSSSFGRASHTLINTNNTLLSLSGFEFETSKTKAAQNAFVMVYDLGSSTWGAQFGVITQSFLQRHAVAIIGGSVAGFVLILVLASICARLWRKHTRRGLPTKVPAAAVGGGGRKRTTKPFLASTAPPNSGSGMATDCSAAVASRLSGMTLLSQNQNQGAFETQIDLSTVPRASESTIHDNYQYPQHRSYNPYAPTQQQQQVPLMSANALQQQDQEMDPYRDDDGLEERDMCLLSHSPPNSGGGEVPHMGSFVHAGQTTGVSGVPVRGQMAPSCTAAPNAGSTSGP